MSDRLTPSDWKEIRDQAAASGLLWEKATADLTNEYTRLHKELVSPTKSVEDIRYIQGQLYGLERGILVVGRLLKRANRALTRAEGRNDAQS